MKVCVNLILLIVLIGCKNESRTVSYNPFEPNYSLKTKMIMKDGFVLKWGCDGGINTYFIDKGSYGLYFFEDCLKRGLIIGENYSFHIDSIRSYNWETSDSLKVDFNKYKDAVEEIITQFGGKLIETSTDSSSGNFKISVLYVNDSIYNCNLRYDVDGVLNLEIENWYR